MGKKSRIKRDSVLRKCNRLRGIHLGLYGDARSAMGNASLVYGDLTGVCGNLTGLQGNVDLYPWTREERRDGVPVQVFVEVGVLVEVGPRIAMDDSKVWVQTGKSWTVEPVAIARAQERQAAAKHAHELRKFDKKGRRR